MDFTLDDDQQAAAELAATILTDKVTEARLRELSASGDLFDEVAWQAMVDAGLVALCVPEAHGGSGYGILEACLIAEEVGRRVAPVPYVAAVVAAMTLARFGGPDHAQLLANLLDGGALVSLANAQAPAGPLDEPETGPYPVLSKSGDALRLDGRAWFVPWADRSDALLVIATDADGPSGSTSVVVVDTSAAGVTSEPQVTTSGLPEHVVTFDAVALDASARLDADPGVVASWMNQRATVATCAVQAGVSAEALRLTATYTSQRKQFNAPIATFQAVAQRAADAYIDTQAVRFTMWQAAWRLAEGLDADDEIDIAKFWAADGGQRVAHAAQHLHGGIGVDTDYPLHRYFWWAKHLELTLGGATEHLRRLGSRIAGAA